MPDKILVSVGKAIRQFRNVAGVSQEELAARAGVHRTYIGGVERGERNLGVKNLVSISRALGVPASELLKAVDVSANERRHR
jgi:transcriptional regulator with XRE-family HTH domain